MTAQAVDGMTSNGEWTGVPLATLFREVGVRRGASWFRAEGGDASRLSRSVPLEKGLDDAIIAYAYNGESLRPANGYPARLLLPGYEGNACIKWVRRIELADGPGMFRDETSKYTDPLANGTARQFSFVMDAKSIITAPSYPSRLTPNAWTQISGLAWSGRGKIARVDVSTDGGKSWLVAELQDPVLPLAHTRFQPPWQWDGKPTMLMSRAVDETGTCSRRTPSFARSVGQGQTTTTTTSALGGGVGRSGVFRGRRMSRARWLVAGRRVDGRIAWCVRSWPAGGPRGRERRRR